MSLPKDLIANLRFVHPTEIIDRLKRKDMPRGGIHWSFKNEVRPVDLYCYLGARFGQPNGFQNFLRNDDSANLIHWEWVLSYGEGLVTIQGMNFRTEVRLTDIDAGESDRDDFLEQLKVAFVEFGPAMSRVRGALEHWVEFVNPYQRLRHSVDNLMEELLSLGLDGNRPIPDFADHTNPEEYSTLWKIEADKYSKAIGLGFGIRSMIPVMAEAFINLLLYFLMKPEMRKDERLRENAIRQPMDIRIKSLSPTCIGFRQHVDYSHEACRSYQKLANERNDLLHGNVVIEKLRFNDLFFFGKVPVFSQYLSMWERSLGVGYKAVGIDKIKEEIAIVDSLIDYLFSCLDSKIREDLTRICKKFQLGVCLDDGRLGILFPDVLVDFVPMVSPSSSSRDTLRKSD